MEFPRVLVLSFKIQTSIFRHYVMSLKLFESCPLLVTVLKANVVHCVHPADQLSLSLLIQWVRCDVSVF